MRLSVLDYQLRPNSRGQFGANPTQNSDCFSTPIGGILTPAPDWAHYRPKRSPLPVRASGWAEKYWSALRPLNQVKWTVRPRYCGCQVTNATSCILRPQEGTTRVNVHAPYERQPRASYRAQTACRKNLERRKIQGPANQNSNPTPGNFVS